MADAPRLNFITFVVSFARTAAVHFGDVPDPVSGDRRSDLPAAAQMIDVLTMLEEKTRGNLSAEEQSTLEQLLYELRLRYVQARQAEAGDDPSSDR